MGQKFQELPKINEEARINMTMRHLLSGLPSLAIYFLVYILEGELYTGLVHFKFISFFKVGSLVYPLLLMDKKTTTCKKGVNTRESGPS